MEGPWVKCWGQKGTNRGRKHKGRPKARESTDKKAVLTRRESFEAAEKHSTNALKLAEMSYEWIEMARINTKQNG